MKKQFVAGFMAVVLTGCASVHPGKVLDPVSQDPEMNMTISVNKRNDYSDKYNYFLDVTFENKGGVWAHVTQVDLDFSNTDEVPHNIIVGKDLEAWGKATIERKKLDDYNSAMAMSSLILVGAAAVVAAGDSQQTSPLRSAGAASVGTGYGWVLGKGISEAKTNAETSVMVPETHLLAPFTVPSMQFTRRWILVNVPKGRIATFATMTVKTAEGNTGVYKIPLTGVKL